VLVTQGDTIYISEAETICTTSFHDDDDDDDNDNDNDNNDNNNNNNNNASSSNTISKDDTKKLNDNFFDPLLNLPPTAMKNQWSCGLVVIIPIMLGYNTIDSNAIDELKDALRHKYSLGFIGGRPNHAIYFVGFNSNNQLLGTFIIITTLLLLLLILYY